MAFADTTWYCNSVGYAAVTARPQNTAVAAGVVRRQFTAPAVGSERCFVSIVAGTTANVTDATWVLTRGAKTTDGTVQWQECTGSSAMNGDLTNTPNWTAQKAVSIPSLGSIIQRNNGASYQICTTAGTMAASEPAFSNTAGVTTNDGTSVWTSLGPVGNFSGGGAPHARLASAGATTWMASSNTVYVGDNHAESQATIINLTTQAGTAPAVSRILCHNHSGSYPPGSADLMTGATISTTGAVNFQISPGTGNTYYYGLTFRDAVGQSSAQNLTISSGNAFAIFDNCAFEQASTGSTASIGIGAGTVGTVLFNNCTVKFGNTNQNIGLVSGNFIWLNTGSVLAAGSSIPTTLISGSGGGTSLTFEALDLNQITGAILNLSAPFITAMVKDCKLNASATLFSNMNTGTIAQNVRSDSGATAYKSSRSTIEGVETTETTITRVGGAADPTGQVQSRKIVTVPNLTWLKPYRAEPYAVWNQRTGASVTVTVCGTINAGALPQNDEVWLEVEYLGSSSFPIGTIVNTTKANILAAAAAVSSDGSSWNGGGSGAGWSPFKLTTTITPNMAGYIHARVRAAKPSTTYYIDPQVVLS